jgi:outer membrane protein
VNRRLAAGLAGASFTLAVAATAQADLRHLTAEEAVQLAWETSPAIQAVEAQTRGADDQAKAVRGHLLPSVVVADELDHWDSPYTVSLGPGAAFSVRDQNMNVLTAGVRQPIFGLGHLAHEYKAQTRSAEATMAQLGAARADLRAAVETFYLQLFEARALEQIARASEEELTEQVNIAQARLKAGVLTKADVLRVRVSLANAKQQEIQAHAQGEVARANLLGRIGLPLDDPGISFEEPAALLAQTKASLPEVGPAAQTALAARAEMKQRKLEAASATEGSKASDWGFAPDVNVEAAYVRTDGTIMNPMNAGVIMLKGQWALFEWGSWYYGNRAAAERAQAAEYQVTEQERRVGVEVASAVAQARAAVAAVDVAEQTIESAEEAYRVTKAALEAGTATTTDLLDAQAALTQARLNLTRAHYEDAMTRVNLRHGMGAS